MRHGRVRAFPRCNVIHVCETADPCVMVYYGVSRLLAASRRRGMGGAQPLSRVEARWESCPLRHPRFRRCPASRLSAPLHPHVPFEPFSARRVCARFPPHTLGGGPVPPARRALRRCPAERGREPAASPPPGRPARCTAGPPLPPIHPSFLPSLPLLVSSAGLGAGRGGTTQLAPGRHGPGPPALPGLPPPLPCALPPLPLALRPASSPGISSSKQRFSDRKEGAEIAREVEEKKK